MSDNNVGYFNAPFAPGGPPLNSASFSPSLMYPASFPNNSGITVYPTFPAPTDPMESSSMTGTEAAIVSYRITAERSALFVSNEVLFSYPFMRDVGLYQAESLKDGQITTLSMLNLKLQQDWYEINRLAAGPQADPVATFARDYLRQGENFFCADGQDKIYGWKKFARVMRDPKLEPFRMASKYGLARINFVGITATYRDVNARMPLGICSANVAGSVRIRNYWGREPVLGCTLGFVFTKKNNGPYQIVPWCTKIDCMPAYSLTSYKDCAGKLHNSRIIRIATMTHANPDHGMIDIATMATGLSTSIQDLTELSTKISHLDCLNATLLTSARHFI